MVTRVSILICLIIWTFIHTIHVVYIVSGFDYVLFSLFLTGVCEAIINITTTTPYNSELYTQGKLFPANRQPAVQRKTNFYQSRHLKGFMIDDACPICVMFSLKREKIQMNSIYENACLISGILTSPGCQKVCYVLQNCVATRRGMTSIL